jgi:biotin carboxyl carrier protein
MKILVDGHPVEIDPEQLDDVREVEPGVYSVILDGRSIEVRAVLSAHGSNLVVDGRRFTAEPFDPRNASPRSKAAIGAGRQKISAPMPGKVIRVLVRRGDVVDAGQGLVVVEAMKMQNEMKAPRPGRVAEVRVRDGETVASGDTLVVLD